MIPPLSYYYVCWKGSGAEVLWDIVMIFRTKTKYDYYARENLVFPFPAIYSDNLIFGVWTQALMSKTSVMWILMIGISESHWISTLAPDGRVIWIIIQKMTFHSFEIHTCLFSLLFCQNFEQNSVCSKKWKIWRLAERDYMLIWYYLRSTFLFLLYILLAKNAWK